MTKTLHLTKFSVHRVMGETSYASNDALMESLNTIKAAWNIPIGKYLRDIVEGRVDAISFTRDRPYYYFFGRRFEKSLSITIKESEKVIDFSIPLQEVEKILTV